MAYEKCSAIYNNEELIYEAPAIIQHAWFFPDRVMILYDCDQVRPRNLGPELRHVLTDEELKLVGQNILMIGPKGEIIWEIEPSVPMTRRHVQDFGYFRLYHAEYEPAYPDDPYGWIASDHSDKSFVVDIETGKTTYIGRAGQ